MAPPAVRLTKTFLDRVENTGLSDGGVAAAIGVTRQYYSQSDSLSVLMAYLWAYRALSAGLAQRTILPSHSTTLRRPQQDSNLRHKV